MNDGFLNCKSYLSLNNKMKLNILHSFSKNELIAKMKSKEYQKVTVKGNKFQPFISKKFSCRCMNPYKESKMSFFIEHNISDKLIIEFGITNEEMIKNINKFRKFAKMFIKLFSKYSNVTISNDDRNVFKLLKYHENKFKNIDEFRKADINSLFEKDLLISFNL